MGKWSWYKLGCNITKANQLPNQHNPLSPNPFYSRRPHFAPVNLPDILTPAHVKYQHTFTLPRHKPRHAALALCAVNGADKAGVASFGYGGVG